jgi:hypothetical protein
MCRSWPVVRSTWAILSDATGDFRSAKSCTTLCSKGCKRRGRGRCVCDTMLLRAIRLDLRFCRPAGCGGRLELPCVDGEWFAAESVIFSRGVANRHLNLCACCVSPLQQLRISMSFPPTAIAAALIDSCKATTFNKSDTIHPPRRGKRGGLVVEVRLTCRLCCNFNLKFPLRSNRVLKSSLGDVLCFRLLHVPLFPPVPVVVLFFSSQ